MNWFLVFCNVTLVNIILSGDNALAISMAAGRLPADLRKRAIIYGSSLAIVSLILFVAIGSFVIQWPVLKSVAGVVLVWISIHLALDHLKPVTEEGSESPTTHSLWKSISIIALVNLTMSLDNAMAMLGIANGNLTVLVPSLLLAIPVLIFGSHFIAVLLRKFSWIILVAAAYISWIAGSMIADDPLYETTTWDSLLQWMVPCLTLAVFAVVIGFCLWRLHRQARNGGIALHTDNSALVKKG